MTIFVLGFMSGVAFTIVLSIIDRVLYVRRMRKIYDKETLRILDDMH